MMESIFIKLMNMSISASWLVIAVILLRMILKSAPKWTRCIMWGLVGLRLIWPFSWESIFSLIPSAEVVPQDIMYAKNPEIHSGVTMLNNIVNPIISESSMPAIGASVNPMQVAVFVAANIWVLGILVLLGYSAFSYLRIRKRVSVSLRRTENIYYCDYIDTPFILGIIKPKIYIPSGMADDNSKEYVIAHERAHIRRHDHWWKPFGFLLLTVYWFNPVLWAAYILLCRDIELACDEHVIRDLGEADKKYYSEALLSCSVPRKMIAACPLAFGEVGVKNRVKEVLSYKKPAFWILVISFIACTAAAVCFLTNPAEDGLQAPEPFGHSYRVESVVYDDIRYSFAYTERTAPRYQFTSDYMMFVSGDVFDAVETDEWVQQIGKFEEVKLSPLIFDDYFKSGTDGLLGDPGFDHIRKNTKNAWRIDASNGTTECFYYLIQTENGDVYLTYGYDVGEGPAAKEDGDLIRQMFKLVRTDVLSCNAVSEKMNAYIEPAYYPEGFDWEYDELPQGFINKEGKLIFAADWKTDTLVISEDYYNNYNVKDGTKLIEKETYTIQKNKSGQFELDVALRSANGDMAVYFVQGENGVYVMKILFTEDNEVIGDSAESAPDVTEWFDDSQEPAAHLDLEQAVSKAILDHYASEKSDGLIHVESHALLANESMSGTPLHGQKNHMEKTIVYLLVMHMTYSTYDGKLEERGGSYGPAVLTFSIDETGAYTLEEYWEPRDGSYYTDDIRDKFPEQAAEEAFGKHQDYSDELSAQCYRKALEILEATGSLDITIEELLEEVCASPVTFSSNPSDYIMAHEAEYRELLNYGEFTLRYCFGHFLQGGQSDLRGHIMAIVCREIAQGWGEAILMWDSEPPIEGQAWFDLFLESAQSLAEQYNKEELEKYYPASWLLLQITEAEKKQNHGSYVGYISDSDKEKIDIHTSANDEYVTSIPTKVVSNFPHQNSEQNKPKQQVAADFYCGMNGNMKWVYAVAKPVFHSSIVNLYTASINNSETENYYFDITNGGIVTGAVFVSEKVGFIGISIPTDLGFEIYATLDSGVSWKAIEVEPPKDWSNSYFLTPVMNDSDIEDGIYPFVLDKLSDKQMIYLTTDDYGSTWRWSE